MTASVYQTTKRAIRRSRRAARTTCTKAFDASKNVLHEVKAPTAIAV
ncbi:hypothetical protein [Kordiimonas pumila]|uniref:Uncharacterized protein n=1 Tax=Kordiimonas pumila TaxID=2161677 RepID=A0ABV7D9R2_9PROT|nr:hypothetical protein [Kordiimonas pumila]